MGCAGKSVAQGARTEKSCWEKLKPLGQKQEENQAVPVNSSQHSRKPCFLLPWDSFFPAQHLILILDTAAEHDRVVKGSGYDWLMQRNLKLFSIQCQTHDMAQGSPQLQALRQESRTDCSDS